MTTGIFISYRREDAAGHAGRLFDRVAARFGAAAVFMDHYDLAPGADFERVILGELEKVHTVLAVIGPRWLDARDADGARRLFQSADFVRRELAMALARDEVTVVPVLVAGAALPTARDLPAVLAPLARRQAVALRDDRFDDDVAALLARLSAAGVAAAGEGLASRLAGEWLAQVSYPWGVDVTERFSFEVDGEEVIGSGTFLTGAHPMEEVELLDDGVRFVMRSDAIMGDERRQVVHRYRARLQGEELAVRLQSSGGFTSAPLIRFVARRAG